MQEIREGIIIFIHVAENEMNKLVNVGEMRKIEEQANKKGLSYEQMMDKAGQGIARYVLSLNDMPNRTITGLIGAGNNGGDTLVALASLAKSGWKTYGYLCKARSESDPLVKWYLQCGGELAENQQDEHYKKLEGWIRASSVLLDGVLGTGFQLPLKPEVAAILHFIKSMKCLPKVIAVDCPSGVDCDSGEAAPECIPADITICIAAVKRGLLKFPAFNLVGQLEVVDIGLSKKSELFSEIQVEVLEETEIRQMLPVRSLDSHKGTYGTAVVCAGSVNYMGAVTLSAAAAYKSGTGLVRCAVPDPLHMALAGKIPEATWLILPSEQGVISEEAATILLEKLHKTTALLIGPGLGTEKSTAKFLVQILEPANNIKKPKNIGFLSEKEEKKTERASQLSGLIIDADGLRLLSQIPDWPSLLPKETILTPHPGEMSALAKEAVESIQKDRISKAGEYASKWECIVVLKGALTVIAHADGHICILPIATSALAKAGSGDVLAGLITGLRAQGMPAYEAACAGVWIHAKAGQMAAERIGSAASVTASDLIMEIPQVFSYLHFK